MADLKSLFQAQPNILENSSFELMDTHAAWDDISKDLDYALGSSADRARIEENFTERYKYGQAAVNQQQGPDRGVLSNLGHITAESVKSALNASTLFEDVATGDVDQDAYEALAKQNLLNQEAYTPPALQKVQQAFQKISADYEQAEGAWGTTKAIVSNIFETLQQLGNPEGILYLAAQSSGNVIPTIVGAVGGSWAGGPVGAVAGVIAGGSMVEGGHRLVEETTKELQKRGLDPTVENIKLLYTDDSFKGTALKKARLKAAGTVLVDVALGVGIGKIATGPARLAVRQAEQIAARAGKDIATEAGQKFFQAALRKTSANISKGAKIKAHLQALSAEMLSEPVSEATGQLAAGDTINTGELAGEFLGGIGASVATTSIEKAIWGTKIAGTVTAATVLTGKDTLSNARDRANYTKKISAAIES